MDALDEGTPKWLGRTDVESNRLPRRYVCQQIIWEMYEINFRAEFIILDHFLFDWKAQLVHDPEDRLTPSSRRAEILAAMVYWEHDVVPADASFAYEANGLCGFQRQDRITSFMRWWNLMGSWVGVGGIKSKDKSAVQDRLEDLSDRIASFELKELLDVEEICWGHYIRTFYRVFGRPPTLPRTAPGESWHDGKLV